MIYSNAQNSKSAWQQKIKISTSNHMFGRAIWGRLPECIFENFEIAE